MSMTMMAVVSLLTLGQVVVGGDEKQVKLSTEGLVLKSGSKTLTWSGAGFTGKVDGGTAFTGLAQSVSYACKDGEDIDVSGTNNAISLSGKCGAVTVSGLANHVSLDSAASIDVSGRNNTATWARGAPTIVKTGGGNQVLQVKL